MDIKLSISTIKNNQEVIVSGSKSESNRLLILQALYPSIQISNLSNSEDCIVLQNALKSYRTNKVVDIHHTGTAMRFLTSFLAIQEGVNVVLTGSDRMKDRPIHVLVEALNSLGANVSYVEKNGYPPLKICGATIKNDSIDINANVSSQFITSLILIGSSLSNGLKISLKGDITSLPYINMSLSLLQKLGIPATIKNQEITVPFIAQIDSQTIIVESDWSSASYFYSIVALSNIGTKLTLGYFKEDSLQGDSQLVSIYEKFGVKTTFLDHKILIEKISQASITNLEINLNNSPDLAQTIIVTCLGLGITCKLSGLHTLKIKETDRLKALKNELEKFGANITTTTDDIQLHNVVHFTTQPIAIETYQDHRMALSFAPLALKQALIIKNKEVVSKSFPDYWSNLEDLGFCSI